jgi:hypothetical protein
MNDLYYADMSIISVAFNDYLNDIGGQHDIK